MRSIIFLFLFAISGLYGCEGGNYDAENISKVVYSFGDSSVPPEYHRSYTIEITREEIRVVVDSYRDTLADETYPADKETFSKVVGWLNEHSVEPCKNKEDDGCSGGTSDYIAAYDSDNKKIFSGAAYHCAKQNYGTLCGETEAFAKEITKLIPDFDKVMDQADRKYEELYPEGRE